MYITTVFPDFFLYFNQATTPQKKPREIWSLVIATRCFLRSRHEMPAVREGAPGLGVHQRAVGLAAKGSESNESFTETSEESMTHNISSTMIHR